MHACHAVWNSLNIGASLLRGQSHQFCRRNEMSVSRRFADLCLTMTKVSDVPTAKVAARTAVATLADDKKRSNCAFNSNYRPC
jgi:hypothetical protein